MSYTIFYDKAFIKIETKILKENNVIIDEKINDEFLYIPLVLFGDNNVYTSNYKGRKVPVKDWGCLFKGLLFTKQKIIDLANDLESLGYEHYKSRGKRFPHGTFSKWIINGTRTAKTIEEWIDIDKTNDITICCKNYNNFQTQLNSYPKNSIQLAQSINQLQSFLLIETLDENNNDYINIRFLQDKVTKQVWRIKKKRAKELVHSFFALIDENGNGFVRKTKYGHKYITNLDSHWLKGFKNFKKAESFYNKYKDYFVWKKFTIKHIIQEKFL